MQFAEDLKGQHHLLSSEASWRLDRAFVGPAGALKLEHEAGEAVKALDEMLAGARPLDELACELDHVRRLRTALDLAMFAPSSAPMRVSLMRARKPLHEATRLGWLLAGELAAAKRPVPDALDAWVARLRAHPLGRPEQDAVLSHARDQADRLRSEAFVSADRAEPDAATALRDIADARRSVRRASVTRADVWLSAAETKAAQAFAALDQGLSSLGNGTAARDDGLLDRAAWVLGICAASLEAAGRVTFAKASELASHYAEVKARALGLPHLHWSDRLAAWPHARTPRISWGRALKASFASLGSLHPELGRRAQQLVRQGRVGAARAYAPDMAFSHPGSRQTGPYVRLTFDASLSAALALGHELGHACHQSFALAASPLVEDPGHALAEAVALLSERAMLQQLASKPDTLWSLAVAIEQDFTLLVRQPSVFGFERAARRGHAQAGQVLSADELSALWLSSAQSHFGDRIDLSGYQRHWIRSAQIFADPFYAMAYPLGLAAAQSRLDLIQPFVTKSAQNDSAATRLALADPYLQSQKAGGEIDLDAALKLWSCPPIEVCVAQAYERAHDRLAQMAQHQAGAR